MPTNKRYKSVTVYLEEAEWKEFQSIFGDRQASEALRRLIRRYLQMRNKEPK